MRTLLRLAVLVALATVVRADETSGGCPAGMANIDGQFCIDKWEATTIDKNTGQELSPYYTPNPGREFGSSKWQYEHWKRKPSRSGIEMPVIPDIQKNGNFEPMAVSRPDVFPQGFMSRRVAVRACVNAGKRLCKRDEWYRACIGPSAARPRPGSYPIAFPYGPTYQAGSCNYLVVLGNALGLLHRSNIELDDPRLMLAAVNGQRLLARTGAFPNCSNGYGVFDMVGNQDEIVSDVVQAEDGPHMVFAGSFYGRGQPQVRGCASGIKAHATAYFDYSIGYRCCAEVGQ